MLCSACAQVLQIDISAKLDDNGEIIEMDGDDDRDIPLIRASDIQALVTDREAQSRLPYFRFVGTVEELQSGVSQSCHICSERWASLAPDERVSCVSLEKDEIITLYLTTFEVDESNNDEPYLAVHTDFLPEFISMKRWTGRGHTFDFKPWSYEKYCTVSDADIPNATNAEYCKIVINCWLQECMHSHTLCSLRRSTEYPRPARILSLLPCPGGAEEMKCQLLVTAETPWHGNYITLSHRWGGGAFLKLISTKLEEFKKQVPLSLLPKVFGDTFLVASAMGVQYVWIDSLCIIQDSVGDWQEEAPKMHSIYSNAFFNIAAASDWSTSDQEKGLFVHRSNRLVAPCLVQPQFPALPPSHKEWTRSTVLILSSTQMFAQAVDCSMLYSRAWTLQERLLAPRVVHFCKDQLFWECCEVTACETFPRGFDSSFRIPPQPWSYKERMMHMQISQKDLKATWAFLVEDYTTKQLTRPEDRLPAIAGVAKQYASSLDERYLAGLWETDLIFQMLWMVWYGASEAGRYDNTLVRRGPTWSWSSIEAPVLPLGRKNSPNFYLADVLRTQIDFKSNDSRGQVIKGIIHLAARICLLQEVYISDSGEGIYLIPGTNYVVHKKEKESFTAGLVMAHRYSDIRTVKPGNLIVPDDSGYQAATHVLPLLVTFDQNKETAVVATIRGLLLRRPSDFHGDMQSENSFVRCAYFAGTATRGYSLEVFGTRWDFERKEIRYHSAYESLDVQIV